MSALPACASQSETIDELLATMRKAIRARRSEAELRQSRAINAD